MPDQTLEEQVDKIISLKENWDGEGAKPYKRETIDKAKRYIPIVNQELLAKKDLQLGDPEITPGPDGSIDMEWKTDNYELLVNVPEKSEPVSYYWYNKHNEKDELKGKLEL